VRAAEASVIAFSPAIDQSDKEIKGFLYPRMYRHDRVMRVMGDAEAVVRDLFDHFSEKPADLPQEWGEGLALMGESGRARRIADFIAGMTDRYALAEHARYFKTTPELR
jgi:dGTPase